MLAVRRLTRRMGLDELVRAAARLRDRVPNVLVLIAGDGPVRGELERLVASMGLADCVRFPGFVPDDMLPLAYRAADLTVMPSASLEGFGLIAAESLAAGTPCFVTPVGGLPDAVEGLSPALVLRSTGSEAIADGLADALMGVTALPDPRACAAFARANYDWSIIAGRVRRVYEEATR